MSQYLAFHKHLSQGQHTVMVYKSAWLSKRALSGVIISLLVSSFLSSVLLLQCNQEKEQKQRHP